MRLLVDADSAIFKAGCSNETRRYLVHSPDGVVAAEFQYKKDAVDFVGGDPDLEISKDKTAGELSHSISNLKNIIEPLLLDNWDHEIYIGGKGNFRYHLYPEYKGARDASDRPIHEKQLRDYLIQKYNAVEVHGEEADDRVSWESCTDEGNCMIVSIDKDLNNTPGLHYNYNTSDEYFLEPWEADWNFALQLLTGDRTDNIPGLPGIGKAKAMNVLPNYSEDWLEVVKQEYHDRGFDDQYLVLQGRLLWMRRKKGEMWGLEMYE